MNAVQNIKVNIYYIFPKKEDQNIKKLVWKIRIRNKNKNKTNSNHQINQTTNDDDHLKITTQYNDDNKAQIYNEYKQT